MGGYATRCSSELHSNLGCGIKPLFRKVYPLTPRAYAHVSLNLQNPGGNLEPREYNTATIRYGTSEIPMAWMLSTPIRIYYRPSSHNMDGRNATVGGRRLKTDERLGRREVTEVNALMVATVYPSVQSAVDPSARPHTLIHLHIKRIPAINT
ncbi:hypothetical protein BJ508DRAFT_367110 [Ascobolus immersus RN42]|uniref:Uncharacterized protein n=1 Tax=Ascobolus immersus RN42 TaxID=1160509 RepID=A0A3N4HEV0_ASCIM|nr:hypothetical protein BJ508DRAFT_367110 [Ascobolus immersus RN42]